MMKKLTILSLFILTFSMLKAWNGDIIVSTPNSSLFLHASEGEELRFGYYGSRLSVNDLGQIRASRNDFNRAAYPVFGTNIDQENAMQVVHADGDMTLDLTVADVEEESLPDAAITRIKLADKVYPFYVDLCYKAYKNIDVIETWAEISHKEKKPVILKKFASGHILVRNDETWITHFHGSWGAEAEVTTEPLTSGIKEIRNIDGARNGLDDRAAVMISLDGRPQENSGRVIGAVLCWNGNFKIRVAPEYKWGYHLTAGIDEYASEYKLEPGELFSTPSLALTFSSDGLGGASRNYHRWARNGMVHNGSAQRDILLNSWEGVYLDVKEPEMYGMIRNIASLGGELFVMDDGWFGTKYPRDTDSAGLGDWIVDTRKLPSGIDGLIKTAKENGVKFGIWIEPENINSKSVLFDEHPDWALQSKHEIKYGRGGTQLLLDLCNPKVQDAVFTVVDTLLTSYPEIAYIKWDANVNLKNYGSKFLPADKQSHIGIAYHKGLEKVLHRIRDKYPDVVIQACGSGGGRANYGVMPYFDEFWVSDNTDALQRLYIQWGTSHIFPAMAMAQHVSAAPNHQTGRSLPLKFRFDVAMTGRLGMELQPSKMSDSERDFSRNAIAEYKTIRPVVQQGDLYRLISPFDKKGVSSLMYVTPDKSRAVFFCYKLDHFNNQWLPRLKMAGLDPGKKYRIREVNVADGDRCYLDGAVFSGSMLMDMGFEAPLWKEYASRVLELTVVD